MSVWRRKLMYRIRWQQAALKGGAAAVVLTAGFFLIWHGKYPAKDVCRLGKYQQLVIWIPEQEEISDAEVKHMVQSVCEQTGEQATKELEKVVAGALRQERLYETEVEKRRRVLHEIYEKSTVSGETEDVGETLLLAVYEKAGLTLTEEEKNEGIKNLQDVFGVSSKAELARFLSGEEQLRAIKKEKTYKYLLENNRFVTVPAADIS